MMVLFLITYNTLSVVQNVFISRHIDDIVQGNSNSIVSTVEFLQSCTKPLISSSDQTIIIFQMVVMKVANVDTCMFVVIYEM